MSRKVRPNTHRGNGSAPQAKAGLSEGRLALVHRYMVDADEAEAEERARVAAQADETGAQTPPRLEASPRPAAEQELRVEKDTHPPSAREDARARRAAAREEKRAAKQAARVIAALEKKEARERKALAKAAARRRPKGR